ncbi:demethylmenaquinone methyltransferase [Candidatus Methanomassiliicoccus intestinalis]|uniref:Demethylmenaquinone methyltransferase n=1 Tax=Methanomassiliicoccus intestinalis (strain Issoire-Mx1) TaxID=1295009 RepID=R9T601_METII|nr:demethylmenaquinone methyltransferase [Candidatus Methanomassiliicoccus intestinalis]AGN26417.1 ubiquinone/menaquinone biosynthesis methyltransferase [Candidatus Methanomassiliicoccus intestinalis Issoire-Mx1]
MKDDKEEKVQGVFQRISGNYDIMNDIISVGLHRGWKDSLADEISQRGKCILDVCCGTGDLTVMLSKKDSSNEVIGLDFSQNMLSVAKERMSKNEIKDVELIQGNAMDLPFEDNRFDCAVISFGLRNVADYSKVISEMTRVIKKGGWVYCLEASYPDSKYIKPFFRLYFRYIMPRLAGLITGKQKEYEWLNESTELFLKKDELADLFKECGLANVSYKTYLLGSAALHKGQK